MDCFVFTQARALSASTITTVTPDRGGFDRRKGSVVCAHDVVTRFQGRCRTKSCKCMCSIYDVKYYNADKIIMASRSRHSRDDHNNKTWRDALLAAQQQLH